MEANIKPWFSGSPVSVEPDASALEAHDRMVRFGIRHLPVVDTKGQVVGVLSMGDLRAHLPIPLGRSTPCAAEEREQALEWRVSDVMTPAPATVGPEASLREAADRMADGRIGCLPVVDDEGCLAGLDLEQPDDLGHLFSETDFFFRVGQLAHGEFLEILDKLTGSSNVGLH